MGVSAEVARKSPFLIFSSLPLYSPCCLWAQNAEWSEEKSFQSMNMDAIPMGCLCCIGINLINCVTGFGCCAQMFATGTGK